jgi:hypothetical protein
MKLIITLLSKELMPFEKKIDYIAKARPLFISNQDWLLISQWNILEKGEQVV